MIDDCVFSWILSLEIFKSFRLANYSVFHICDCYICHVTLTHETNFVIDLSYYQKVFKIISDIATKHDLMVHSKHGINELKAEINSQQC